MKTVAECVKLCQEDIISAGEIITDLMIKIGANEMTFSAKTLSKTDQLK